MWGHRVAAVGLAVAVLACGGGDDDAADGSLTSTTGTDATTAPSTSVTDGSQSDTDDVEPIDSVRWGPDDPPIPGEYSAFATDSASGLACASIDDRAVGDEFWTLAAAICRVFTGEGGWPDVSSVPDPAPQDLPYQTCLDAELHEMLQLALAWHAEHPGQSPVVRFPASGRHSPCQTALYDVAVIDTFEPGESCRNDNPMNVPSPGVPVVFSAPGIDDDTDPMATVDGIELCVVDESSQQNSVRRFVVVVPTTGAARTVTLEVESNFGTLRAEVEVPAGDDSVTGSTVAPGTSDPTGSTPTGTTDTGATETVPGTSAPP